MNVLSLFDGISCGQVALKNLNIPVDTYWASEIDKNAIAITQKNFPKTIQIGDVRNISFNYNADIIFGGFPCQDLSRCSHDRKCLEGKHSGLFFRLLDCIQTIKPRYFLVENVAGMPDESKNIISDSLGVKPIFINSQEVSAQRRKRLYWTNIPFSQENKPKDKYMHVEELLEENAQKMIIPNKFVPNNKRERERESTIQIGNVMKLDGSGITKAQAGRVYSIKGKTVSLCAQGGGYGAKTGLYKVGDVIRKLTPLECERAQGLPDNYTAGISESARYKTIGNGWNVKTIEWLLKGII